MSSAFNLSTLVAMQDQRVEQVSVHFWRCQLTSGSPRFDWNPDAKLAASDKGANGAKETDKDAASEDIDEDSDVITRHLLHVTGCVLGPKAEGIHLVTVRTRGYQQQPAVEPEPCPILCMDPAAQRTLALGHEFVLEPSKNAAAAPFCAFELAEGSGPAWLTGTHRVHRVVPSGAGDFEEEEEDGEGESAAEDEEDEAGAEDEEEDIAEESEAEEEEDEYEELVEEVRPAKKGKGRQPAALKQQKPAQKQKAQPAAAKQQRKRAKPDS